MTAEDLAEPLLAVLRARLGEPGISYSERPAPLADGVTARTFALRLDAKDGLGAGPLVCRVFASQHPNEAPDQTHVEHALHDALIGMGFPAPRVLESGDATGPLGAPFLVMERVPGTNAFVPMVGALAVGCGLLLAGTALPLLLLLLGYWAFMVRLLSRLHGLPTEPVVCQLERHGLSPERLSLDAQLEHLERRVVSAELEGLRSALRWLRERRPSPAQEPAICHGDFWLGNLMHGFRGGTLIDWTQACLTYPELDLGWMRIQHYSRVPLAFAVNECLYDVVATLIRPFAWLLLGANGVAYRLVRRVDPERLRYFTALNAVKVLVRIGVLRRASAAADGVRPAELVAWGSPATIALLRRRVRRITGVEVAL